MAQQCSVFTGSRMFLVYAEVMLFDRCLLTTLGDSMRLSTSGAVVWSDCARNDSETPNSQEEPRWN